jgi:hypothetical protein
METKHYGEIYRPYADFIGDIQIEIENQLMYNTDLARFFLLLTERDFMLVGGKMASIFIVSESIYRRYPLRTRIDWSESLFIPEHNLVKILNISDQIINLAGKFNPSELETNLRFTNSSIIVIPTSLTSTTTDKEARTTAIKSVADILMEKEQTRYERSLAMQKPKDIFLSHKGIDKPFVREIANTLRAISFSPWLDEDRMPAGTNLERGIRKGFEDSCAAVFFVTPNFKDENYLATEIDYALQEKRAKGERFQIITLLLKDENGNTGNVPKMLNPYVWKEIENIEVIRTIVAALPIQAADIIWKT